LFFEKYVLSLRYKYHTMKIKKIIGWLCFILLVCLVIGLVVFEIMNWNLSRWEILCKVWWLIPIFFGFYLGTLWGLELKK